uniref:cysteine desulfurase family protein n=1 Tax=uncultured Altererythrobacter sp. TaxID=500840 RepID=UPI0026042D57|nr:aminotransferase class V-fold PLP-dependent enzyme [uncultured Altererythrobacter sp.]
MTQRIYLDHAATSPLRPEAKAAMDEGFRIWANPSSPHAEGRKAKAALEDARERIKAALGWDGELIFTSGASEAAALALHQADAGARIVSAVEHDCILQAAPEAERLPVQESGQIVWEELEDAVQTERPLVAIQHANSETGQQQFLYDVHKITQKAGGLLLADCAQTAGKINLPECDMAIISAHKFGGPIGIGALLVKDYAMLKPSGGHERGYRRGTENMPAALGMAAALECESYWSSDAPSALYELEEPCKELGGTWLENRLSNPTWYLQAIAMPNMSATAQVMRFDMAGIAVSQGSACSSGTMKTSRVLDAMQVPPETAANTIRVSLGWNSTRAEVERFCEVWLELAKS